MGLSVCIALSAPSPSPNVSFPGYSPQLAIYPSPFSSPTLTSALRSRCTYLALYVTSPRRHPCPKYSAIPLHPSLLLPAFLISESATAHTLAYIKTQGVTLDSLWSPHAEPPLGRHSLHSLREQLPQGLSVPSL